MGKRARLALRGFGAVAALILLVLAVGVLVPARALADEPTTVASGNVSSTVTWKIDSDGLLSIEGTGDADLSRGDTYLWGDNLDKVKQVSISPTVNITGLSGAFSGCTNLTSVDTSSWTIDSEAKIAEGELGFDEVFKGCTSLETANVTGLVSSKMTTLQYIFQGCTSLKTIEGLSSWDTSGATFIIGLFDGCSSLESLDLSSFDCSSLSSCWDNFTGCDSLNEVSLGKQWKFSKDEHYYEPLPDGTAWNKSGTSLYYKSEVLASSYDGSTMYGTYVRVPMYSISATITNVSGSIGYSDKYDTQGEQDAYYILAWGLKGSQPSASASFPSSDTVKLRIFPDTGYSVSDVTIDGEDQGAISTFTFSDLSADHDVRVTFAKDDSPSSYLVTVTYGEGGTEQSKTTAYSPHESCGYSFTPKYYDGYVVDDVKINGVSQGPITYYYFDDLSTDYVIEVSFKKGEATYHRIEEDWEAESSRRGGVQPQSFVVKDGDSATIHIEEDTGWKVSDVKIDGVSVGACTSYTFDNVTSDHKVAVSYEATSKTTRHVDRLYGQGALDTMKAVVDAGFSSGSDVSGTVVLATGAGYWDALTASGVAGLADAPVLLTSLDGGSLSQQTRDVLARLKPKTIVVCGGALAVPDAVVDDACGAAGGTPRVVRCAGQTATGTACEIYKQGASATGGWYGTTAIIATNDGYWDALAVAPYAYRTHSPIFLAEGHDRLSEETVRTMVDGGIKDAIIVGGDLAVTPAVESQIEAAGIHVETRLAGDNAVLTSAEIAKYDIAHEPGITGACVATTDGYWDALTGAALCGRAGDVLVLANDGDRRAIDEAVPNLTATYGWNIVFGGEMAVSEETRTYFENALNQ